MDSPLDRPSGDNMKTRTNLTAGFNPQPDPPCRH